VTSVTVHTATSATSGTATADCGSGNHALGGGVLGIADNNATFASYPSDASGNAAANNSTNPRAWTAKAKVGSSVTAYAICVSN
jgi:hypothetical protein